MTDVTMTTHVHSAQGDPSCFGCKMQLFKTEGMFALGAAATATRSKDKAPPRVPNCSWEAGRAGERRPGGGFMPYLKPGTTTPMGVKEAGERRHEINKTLDRYRNDPNPFGGKG